MRVVCVGLAALLSGCVIQMPAPTASPPPPDTQQTYSPAADSAPAEALPAGERAPDAAVSVDVEPPLSEPAPIAVGWAPPPMLVEVPSPAPFPAAVWVGGYWVWQGNWIWAHGRWVAPPGADYGWVHPYYEHRGDEVIFIDGHWSRRGVVFVPPPPGLRLAVERPAYGVLPGPRPLGPDGCFVPAPPGSRAGIIIPAPMGTAPAVVTSAPAVVNVGMRITNNVTHVTNITNVTIVAPAAATASGHAFNTAVPAAPHLAAARPALVQARAPEPVSLRPLPAYVPGSRPPVLPHPQPVVNGSGPGGRAPPAFAREPATAPVPTRPQNPVVREPPPHVAVPATETAMNDSRARDPYARSSQPVRETPPAHQVPPVHQAPPVHATPDMRDSMPLRQGQPAQPARQLPPAHSSAASAAPAAHAAPGSASPAPAHPGADKPQKSDPQSQRDKHEKQTPER